MAGRTSRTVPLRWRLFALFVLLVSLNVVDTAVTVSTDARLQDLQVVETRLNAAAQVQERLRGIRDGQLIELRGFVPTGDPTFLREYLERREDEQREGRALRSLLQDEPELLREANQLSVAMATWRRLAARPIIVAVQSGESADANDLVTDVGEPLIDAARADATSFERNLDERLGDVRTSVESARDDLNTQLLVSSVLALIVVAGAAWALRRWIALPVASLSEQVDRVAAGYLREPVRGTGPTEFQKLGDDVEHMRRRIVTELEQSQRAVEAMEQHAPLVASLRAQLRPTTPAALPTGLRIVGRLEPATGVLAGDWYDVIRLDASRATLIIVDVSGHGHEAGLRALWLKHLLSPAVQMGLEPGEALNWVASEVGDTGDWFATCVIVEIDAATGRCLYANAGHPPPLLFGADGVETLHATGTLFGGLPRERWRTAETSVGVGETLVVYTDGITENRNTAGEMFGDDGLISCIRAAPRPDPHAVVDHVMSTVHAFGRDRLVDDATLALVTCAPAEGDGVGASGTRGLGQGREHE